MKLEEEIQQPRFRSELHKLAVNITYTHFWLMDKMAAMLKPHGLSIQQFNILRILRGQYPKPSTINLLKERMLDKHSDASRLVERLRVKGLVERRPCSSDLRSVDILISGAGLALLDKIDEKSGQMDHLFDALTAEDAHKLNKLLDKLRD